MVRAPRPKPRVQWWRGYELYAIVGLFWFVVIGVWLALLLGSQATGTIISSNPITAVVTLFLGHMKWPGGWATALVVLEGAFLVFVTWLARIVLLERATREEKSGKARSSG